MKRTKVNYTVGIIQCAVIHFGIHLIKVSIKETLRSHPAYPTSKNICDTLDEWKIENYPLRYSIDKMMESEAPYIVHFTSCGGHIIYLTGNENDSVKYYTAYNKKRKLHKKVFFESSSIPVILLNQVEESVVKDFSTKRNIELINKSLLPLILLVMLPLIIYSFTNNFICSEEFPNKVILPLLFTKIAGIMFSVILVLRKFEVHFSLTDI